MELRSSFHCRKCNVYSGDTSLGRRRFKKRHSGKEHKIATLDIIPKKRYKNNP